MLLDVSGIQGHLILQDESSLQEPVLFQTLSGLKLLDVSGVQGAVLLQYVSVLQELLPCCTRTWLVYLV